MQSNITTSPESENCNSRFARWCKDIWIDLKKNKSIYLIMLPGIIFYLLFHYVPMYGVSISFQDYSAAGGMFGSPWVGLKWFKEFFCGIYAKRVILNTLILNFYLLLFSFPLPIILALLMNELRGVRFKKSVQTITYLPHFISVVVLCGMVVDFTSSGGFITGIVNSLTGEKFANLLYESSMYRIIYVASVIWQGTGWNSIIYLAALTGIDTELYEAAQVDGAMKLRQLWHITLPGILPTIVVMLILKVGQMMSLGADMTILLYNPVVYEKADIISSFVYRYGLTQNNYSYSAAVGVFNSVINCILVLSANWVSKKVSGSGLF